MEAFSLKRRPSCPSGAAAWKVLGLGRVILPQATCMGHGFMTTAVQPWPAHHVLLVCDADQLQLMRLDVRLCNRRHLPVAQVGKGFQFSVFFSVTSSQAQCTPEGVDVDAGCALRHALLQDFALVALQGGMHQGGAQVSNARPGKRQSRQCQD